MPAFRDPDLEVPSVLHSSGCPGALRRDGGAAAGSCRCSSATWSVERSASVTLLIERGSACLVQVSGYGPVWVESEMLVTDRGVPLCPVEPSPSDDEVLARWLTENPSARWPRRRIRPRGGDLVLVREEYQSGTLRPWRFLFTVRLGAQPHAALLDPSVPPVTARVAGWSQLRYLALTGDPWRCLLVAFPLPDGAESPGWRSSAYTGLRRAPATAQLGNMAAATASPMASTSSGLESG